MKILLTISFVCFWYMLAFSKSVILSWDPNSEDDLAGYNIYYGTSSGSYDNAVDVGNNISWIKNLVVSATYYFVATAYDTVMNESDYSNEVNITITGDIDNIPTKKLNIDLEVFQLNNPVILEVVAYSNEIQDETGWTIGGHINRTNTDAGLYILNPEQLIIRVVFDAKIIGYGVCIEESRPIRIESAVWFVYPEFNEVEFITNAQRPFINFVGDCWIPNESNANLRIENIRIFK